MRLNPSLVLLAVEVRMHVKKELHTGPQTEVAGK